MKSIQLYLLLALSLFAFFTTSCEDEITKVTIEKKTPVITWPNPANIAVNTLLSSSQLNATADVSGIFVYTPPAGTSLSVGSNQELKVDFSPHDITNYNAVSKTVKINVIVKKNPIITWSNPADITVNTILSSTQLNATADVSGTFVYTPLPGTSLSIGSDQELKVDFTPTDIINYNTTSQTVKVNVIAAPIDIQTVNIPAGTFAFGSPTGLVDPNATKQYQVTLTAFRMSKYEITNEQYATFLNNKYIGSNGMSYSSTKTRLVGVSKGLVYNYYTKRWQATVGYENHPVTFVTWYGAFEFADFVNAQLPTSAQWEYACRAGTTTRYNTGDCLTNLDANYHWGYPDSSCTNTVTTYLGVVQAVGSYPANAWGLHDMHGNVSEWCYDWASCCYPNADLEHLINPSGPVSGTERIHRGGTFGLQAYRSRTTHVDIGSPNEAMSSLGFRVAYLP